MRNLRIGADPEVFLVDKETGEIVSAIGLIGGDKENPKDISVGCSVQEDNVLAEYNIPPAATQEEFVTSNVFCQSYIEAIAASAGAKLHFVSSAIIPEKLLEDEKACVLGCAPSLNVITESVTSIDFKTIPDELRTLRTSGFHIHFGWDKPTEAEMKRVVMAFELMCSIPLSLKDKDPYDRRKFYGLFGDYRIKSYGVECRSLGGYFIKDAKSIADVYNKSVAAFNLAMADIYSTATLQDMLDHSLVSLSKVNPKGYREVMIEIASTKKLVTK